MVKQIIVRNSDQIKPWSPNQIDNKLDVEQLTSAFTEIRVEDLQQQAYRQGYAEAEKKFSAQLEVQMQNQLDLALSNEKMVLNELIQELNRIKSEVENVIKKELMSLCLALVEKICHKKFSEDDELIKNQINHALSLMPSGGGQIDVFVCEETFEKIAKHVKFTDNEGHGINLKRDEKLKIGDFIINSHIASIDGLLDHRVQKYKNNL